MSCFQPGILCLCPRSCFNFSWKSTWQVQWCLWNGDETDWLTSFPQGSLFLQLQCQPQLNRKLLPVPSVLVLSWELWTHHLRSTRLDTFIFPFLLLSSPLLSSTP
jgi:hypothetical protein